MNEEGLKYKIGLGLMEGIGNITAKKLIAYCGGVEAIFQENKKALEKVPGIGKKLVDAIKTSQVLDRAMKEEEFILKNNIQPLFYLDDAYPKRLKQCDDGPIMLYTKGEMNLNVPKVISIVGTRNATPYGKKVCDKIIEGLKDLDVLVVSGLAYGIDINAHKAALKNEMQTVGVLAHGLDRIYPALHAKVASEMQHRGGIATEYLSETNPDRENFPQRNRIIAGMTDAVIVMESKQRGGSLITAEIANNYNRDVFALPGRVNDDFSQGCNWLIKTNRATLVESAEDITRFMQWDVKEKKNNKQAKLFHQLTKEQEILVNLIQKMGKADIDTLCLETKMKGSEVAALLLNLEFDGVINTLPGKVYQLC